MCASWSFVYFVTDVAILIFRSMIIPCYIIPVFLMFCEYIQTYSLACPWLLSWPDFSLGDEPRGDNLGAYVLTIAASRR